MNPSMDKTAFPGGGEDEAFPTPDDSNGDAPEAIAFSIAGRRGTTIVAVSIGQPVLKQHSRSLFSSALCCVFQG